MKYGRFAGNGSQYIINTPKTPNKWYNYLFNDSYYMEISQTAQGNSQCLEKGIRTFTRGYRYFYVKNNINKEIWSPNYRPLKSALDNYECIHSLGSTEIISEYKGIETSIRAFVPREGVQEVWTLKVKNNMDEAQDLSLFSVYSFENGDPMGSKADYDKESGLLWSFTFPYHVYYEEKEKLDDKNSLIYMFADSPINSYDCSEKRFFGGDDTTEIPAAIINDSCSNFRSEWDNPLGAFEHKMILKPGEEKEINIFIGCAKDLQEASVKKEKWMQSGVVEKELRKVEEYWEGVSNQFIIETPDKNLDYLVNYWLKKQVTLMARNNRLSVYCPVRNQLQDAMGYSMIDTKIAEELMIKVIKRQEKNGFIKQWYMTDGSAPKALCLLNHMDAPIWLVSCMCSLVNQAGNIEILDREVEYKDSDEKGTIYEHMLKAVYYLSEQTGEHGLCLMGDGDWTDPINGAGRLGKGESTWSTMGLKYAARQLIPFARKKGDVSSIEKLESIAARLDDAINTHCWDGNWYVTGFDDFGVPFGKSSDEEGKIFLNSQTWAIMSETARGERLEKCKEAIEGLNSASGPLLLAPAFSDWNKTWGRISIKLAGSTENGSVYCHASMFKAYSDCLAGDGNKAYETIIKTLPTNPENDPDKNLQVPLFVPNFYFGLKDSPNFGQSSNHNGTGTAAWLLWVVIEHMLGAKATVDGIQITPCIPAEWKQFNLKRKFNNALYEIKISNPLGVQLGVKEIYVNGNKINGNLLPYKEGENFTVEVIMG